jgi:hypothetical protein
VNFFSELRPGALREGVMVAGLSPAQLEVLRLVLEKEEVEERDEIAHGLQWLAIIATVSPLLGLLGNGARRHELVHRRRGGGLCEHQRGRARASPRR